MKFSVIIPVYNLEAYITRCLESFTKQNFDPKDFELVIVNDGSTDESLKIIENFAKHFIKYKIEVFTTENGGSSSARNFGIAKALGEYVWFVDGDDWVPINALKDLFSFLLKYNSPDILEFDCEIAIDTDRGLKYRRGGNHLAKSVKIETGKQFLEDHEYSLGPTVKIYRREFLLTTGCLFPIGRLSEDNLFSLETLMNAKTYIKINEVYYTYYQRQNSNSRTKTVQHLKKYYSDIIFNMIEMRRITQKESLAIRNTISRMSSFFVLLMMLDLVKNKKFSLIKYFAKQLKMNNLYPLVSLEMDYIKKKKFDVLRRIVNVYIKFI